jgi:hypothetical protein
LFGIVDDDELMGYHEPHRPRVVYPVKENGCKKHTRIFSPIQSQLSRDSRGTTPTHLSPENNRIASLNNNRLRAGSWIGQVSSPQILEQPRKSTPRYLLLRPQEQYVHDLLNKAAADRKLKGIRLLPEKSQDWSLLQIIHN